MHSQPILRILLSESKARIDREAARESPKADEQKNIKIKRGESPRSDVICNSHPISIRFES